MSATDSPFDDGVPGADGVATADAVFDSPMDFDPDELREFLAADIMDVPHDPQFKELLRQKLWALIQARYVDDPGEPS